MKLGINEKYQIKQIGTITDNNLIQIELDETSGNYPFKNWSNERILCYCYDDTNGVSIYPYVDTNKIIDIENQALQLQAQVIELEFEKIGGTSV